MKKNVSNIPEKIHEHNGVLQHSDEIVQTRTGSAENEILRASQPEQANLLVAKGGAGWVI